MSLVQEVEVSVVEGSLRHQRQLLQQGHPVMQSIQHVLQDRPAVLLQFLYSLAKSRAVLCPMSSSVWHQRPHRVNTQHPQHFPQRCPLHRKRLIQLRLSKCAMPKWHASRSEQGHCAHMQVP